MNWFHAGLAIKERPKLNLAPAIPRTPDEKWEARWGEPRDPDFLRAFGPSPALALADLAALILEKLEVASYSLVVEFFPVVGHDGLQWLATLGASSGSGATEALAAADLVEQLGKALDARRAS